MNYFYIKKLNIDGFDIFLLWLSFESILDNLNYVEENLRLHKLSGKLLIDQLFITGNGESRFICCDFKNGKLDLKTVHIINPSNCFRKETVQWLHDNYDYVENSILTESQRQKVKNCILF